MKKIIEFLKDTRLEFKHIIWPTKNQAIFFTVLVIVLSVFIAYLLGLFDFLFSRGLEKVLLN